MSVLWITKVLNLLCPDDRAVGQTHSMNGEPSQFEDISELPGYNL